MIHVEGYAPQRAPFSNQSKPTATQVGELMTDAEAQVEDALIGAGYAVPVPTTATVAHRLVQAAVAKCTVASIEEVAPTSERRRQAREMCDRALKMIRDGELPGLDKDAGESAPRSGFGASPYFDRDMVL